MNGEAVQMNSQNPKAHKKKKIMTKVLCVIIAILLMIGIATVVALIIHKNSG